MVKKQICKGLSLTKNQDGIWMNFESNGLHASINILHVINVPKITKAAILSWANEQLNNETQ